MVGLSFGWQFYTDITGNCWNEWVFSTSKELEFIKKGVSRNVCLPPFSSVPHILRYVSICKMLPAFFYSVIIYSLCPRLRLTSAL